MNQLIIGQEGNELLDRDSPMGSELFIYFFIYRKYLKSRILKDKYSKTNIHQSKVEMQRKQ